MPIKILKWISERKKCGVMEKYTFCQESDQGNERMNCRTQRSCRYICAKTQVDTPEQTRVPLCYAEDRQTE